MQLDLVHSRFDGAFSEDVKEDGGGAVADPDALYQPFLHTLFHFFPNTQKGLLRLYFESVHVIKWDHPVDQPQIKVLQLQSL